MPDGSGVIIGIVDYGCDFAHRNFCNGRQTRLLALWHQDGPSTAGQSPAGFGYGQEFTADAINQALEKDDPYETLGYEPEEGAHGTHVMDIAAGNGCATGNPGVAPNADIIFVHVSEAGSSNAKHLVEAVDYIFQKADELGQPAVVNVSMGTHKGPHDGTTLSERWLDKLLEAPNRAIVVSAGNSWRHRAHAEGITKPDEPSILPWIIQPNDPTNNEMEIWYNSQHQLSVTLRKPDSSIVATVPRGSSGSFENDTISIIHNAFDPRNGDHQISILLDKSLSPTGPNPAHWQIELESADGQAVPFQAWIERDDAKKSNLSFFHPAVVSPSHSLGSLSCGHKTITVAAYRADDPDKGISALSSQGPTRDGRSKPEISAPGQYVAAPRDQSGILAAKATTNSTTRKSGTSMAAPHVTGSIALMLQTADKPLSIDQIRAQLLNSGASSYARTVGVGSPGRIWSA